MDRTEIINEFKEFLAQNCDKIQKKIINASDISSNDEWMKETQWDEIYKKEKLSNGKV